MTHAELTEELRLAQENVVEGEERLNRQRHLIADLDRGGHPTETGQELLAVLEDAQALLIEDRDRLALQISTIRGGAAAD